MNFTELTHIATLAALEAGELLLSGFSSPFSVTSKQGRHDLVTEYDLSSQKRIIEKIASRYPNHNFLAEEEGVQGSPSDQVLWIIDPLDGTINFARGIPFFAISIAAAIGSQIVAGVVYSPMTNELFTAEKGGGAFLHGKQISVSKEKELRSTVLATGFPYDVEKNPKQCIERFSSFVRKGMPMRRLGAASLDLAYVAAGRFDGFWEVGLQPWDMAAGKLLVEEAGGKVTHYDGSSHKIFGYYPTLATNGYIHAEMVESLKEDLR